MKPSRRTMIRLVLAHAGAVASGVGLLMASSLVGDTVSAQAQGEGAAVDPSLRVISFDGQPLSLYAGPSSDQPVVASLSNDELVTLLGNAQASGIIRWVPVRTASNQVGWISDQYLAGPALAGLVTAPSVTQPPASAAVAPPPAPVVAEVVPPTPTSVPPPPLPTLAPPTPTATVPQLAAAPPVNISSTPVASAPLPVTSSLPQDIAQREASAKSRQPLEVEAKVKFPEAKGRHQEVTIWVTRDGVPIPGAFVTIFTDDDEDEPLRVLEPTNIDGRTRREFAIGREKGSIELTVAAVAPDGGEGKTSVSYFRR